MTEEELNRILRSIQHAYEAAGERVLTAVMFDEYGERIVIDNREEEDIN